MPDTLTLNIVSPLPECKDSSGKCVHVRLKMNIPEGGKETEITIKFHNYHDTSTSYHDTSTSFRRHYSFSLNGFGTDTSIKWVMIASNLNRPLKRHSHSPSDAILLTEDFVERVQVAQKTNAQLSGKLDKANKPDCLIQPALKQDGKHN